MEHEIESEGTEEGRVGARQEPVARSVAGIYGGVGAREEGKRWLAEHQVIPCFPPYIKSDLINHGPDGDTLPLSMEGLQVLGFGGMIRDDGGSPSNGS